jgi:HEPN domain-containing protein
MAKVRLKDAQALLGRKRFDGAAYLCGYAVELALKARICKSLSWAEYKVKDDYERFFKTHDLDRLLDVSGFSQKMKSKYLAEWSVVNFWKPDSMRYQPIANNVSSADAIAMVAGAKKLVRVL